MCIEAPLKHIKTILREALDNSNIDRYSAYNGKTERSEGKAAKSH